MKNIIIATDQKEVAINGIHILTICDIKNGRAEKLQNEILRVEKERHRILDFAKNPGKISLMDRIFRSKMVREIEAQIADLGNILDQNWQEYRHFLRKLHSFCKTDEKILENITTTLGRTVLARRLSGDTTYTGIVNYTALGNDNTAANVGDATLGNETYRKALSSGTYLANVAYLETFFSATEVTGTFEEYGMFIDGGAGADTGQLFNRFTETKVKTSSQTLNVQSIVTFADA